MGLFDTVVIEGLKLKTSAEVNNLLKQNTASVPTEFQTKDLDCSLSTYKIDSKGQFWVHFPKETGKKKPYESPFRDWRDNRSFIERLYFKITDKVKYSTFKAPRYVPEIKYVWQKQNTTNTFELYTSEQVGGRYIELSYDVQIVNGKVKKITLKRSEVESVKEAEERKARNEEWDINMKKKFEARNKFVSKWYYPFIKETYNPTIFFLRLALQGIASKLTKLSYRLNGV